MALASAARTAARPQGGGKQRGHAGAERNAQTCGEQGLILLGYQPKAGHFIISMTYFNLAGLPTRSRQFTHLGSHCFKEIRKVPTEKTRGWGRAIRGATIEIMHHRPYRITLFGQTTLLVMQRRETTVPTFNR